MYDVTHDEALAEKISPAPDFLHTGFVPVRTWHRFLTSEKCAEMRADGWNYNTSCYCGYAAQDDA